MQHTVVAISPDLTRALVRMGTVPCSVPQAIAGLRACVDGIGLLSRPSAALGRAIYMHADYIVQHGTRAEWMLAMETVNVLELLGKI